IKIELDEIEYLKVIHNASALQDLTKHPGWTILQELTSGMMDRLEGQHLRFAGKGTRDAYWASGLRLDGAREFATILTQTIDKEIDILNHPLRPPKAADPSEFDGEIRNGQQPEGDE